MFDYLGGVLGAGGPVRQLQQFQLTTGGYVFSSVFGVYEPTGLEVQITPRFQNSYVLILTSFIAGAYNNGRICTSNFRITRNGTPIKIGYIYDAINVDTGAVTQNTVEHEFPLIARDDYGAAAPLTYVVDFSPADANSDAGFYADADYPATIIAMEIAP